MLANPAKRNILVVDDDERIVAEISRALSEREQFTLHTFTCGEAAFQVLQENVFDLVIVDWRMPDMDGLALIREAQKQSEQTITVLMSGYSMAEIKQLNLVPAAHHYLEKPFALDELTNVVESAFPAPPRPKTPSRVLKVVLGGDANVGKTSLIQRYRTNTFDPKRAMTIGVDFHLYDVQIDNEPIRLVVWDLGGQERFCFAREAFYRGTQAVGLVFDASNRTSFYNLMRWWRETREYLPNVPVLMLANKTDLPRQVPDDEARQIALAWNIQFFESSCATGNGVCEFFESLAREAWQNIKVSAIAK